MSMSRKPLAPATGRTGMIRAPSNNNLNNTMPPPRIPAKALAVSTSSNKVSASSDDVPGSRSTSPTGRNKENKRIISGGHGSGKGTKAGVEKVPGSPDENGEMNIQVVVRCRGRSAMEATQRTPNIVSMEGQVSHAITVETGPLAGSSTSSTSALGLPVSTSNNSSIPFSERAPVSKTYSFDKVFGPGADQTLVFKEVVENVLDEVISGYNCTIFAYGQTGTGKTYTMQGDLSLTPLGTPVADAGIIPRVLHRLFAILDAQPNAEYSVKCSYIELYNEELRDLLANDFHAPMGSAQPLGMGGAAGKDAVSGLKIYEDQNKKGGILIQGLEEAGVRNAKEGLALLKKGSERRQTAETNMNAHSSRSHSIMTLTVHIKETSSHGGEDLLKVGKLNLVDLAGSEAIGRSGAVDKRAREAGMINQSLLTLGRVITALVEKNSHVPYRESKLTRMLQDSLGGRTKTCIVATISPTKSNMEETLSTLDYAIRASAIRNKPEINLRMTKGTLIKDYVNQIERMKTELMAAHEKNGGYYMTSERKQELDDELEDLKAKLADATSQTDVMQRKHDTLSAEFEENMALLMATAKELEEAKRISAELTTALAAVHVELAAMKVELEEEKFVSEAYRSGEERIGKIASDLQQTVRETVLDVGGLHAKIARKGDVLLSNNEAANAYGATSAAAGRQLRDDIQMLRTVQSGFGSTLQQELEAFAKRGNESLELDKLFLDEQLNVFGASVAALQQDLGSADQRTLQTCAVTSTATSALRKDMVDWLDRMRDNVDTSVRHIVEQQRSEAAKVEEALDGIANMLDVVIDGALEQNASEMQSALDLQTLATQAAEAQARLLEEQNQRLERLLQEEKAKSAASRDALVAQITSLLLGFSTAQEGRLQNAISDIQRNNTAGSAVATTFSGTYTDDVRIVQQRYDNYRNDLGSVREAAAGQRAEAKQVLEESATSNAKSVSTFGSSLASSADEGGRLLQRHVGALSSAIASTSSTIHQSAQGNNRSVSLMTDQVKDSFTTAKQRVIIAKEDIQLVSSAVLGAHVTAEPIFAEHCQFAQDRLQTMLQSTSTFISGLREDVATGSTPRKRVWNIPSKWTNTASRSLLVEGYRQKRLEGFLNVFPDPASVEIEEIGQTMQGDMPIPASEGETGEDKVVPPSVPLPPAADMPEPEPTLVSSTGSPGSEAMATRPPGQSRVQAPGGARKPGVSRTNTGEVGESLVPSGIQPPGRKVKRNF